MKPRIFIGSSGDAKDYAAAIHTSLMRVAECTVWTEGAFGLSRFTLDELLRHVHNSDFGIFIFAPDDTATIKGEFLKVTRDNVVYEAGLFGGYLTPQRCFIVVPLEARIHLPSDLLGMTVGFYEDERTDKDHTRAVAGFCYEVEKQIRHQGLFEGHLEPRLRELAVKFECCEFIPNSSDPADPSKARVERKREVAGEIATYCRDHAVNKHRLLRTQRYGYAYVLLTAIIQRPEKGDVDLLQQMEPKVLPPVFALFRLVETIEALRKATLFDKDRAEPLKNWALAIPGITPDLKIRIEKATTFPPGT